MSFVLAVMSIRSQYVGTLACFTVVFTPLGLGIDIVLHAVVNKNKAENTANGVGIRYQQLLQEQGNQDREEPTI